MRTAPPTPAVTILFPLNEIQPKSPIVPVCFPLKSPDVYVVPRLSAASSIIKIFLSLQIFISFSKLQALPQTCTTIMAATLFPVLLLKVSPFFCSQLFSKKLITLFWSILKNSSLSKNTGEAFE